MTNLVVVSGGLREPSTTRLLADRILASVVDQLARHDVQAETTVIELRRYGRAIMDAMLAGFPSTELEDVFGKLAAADGLIAVTPAFNASFSGLFKSFFDVLPEETLEDIPVLIAATGGTDRHSLVLEHALRPMFSYLHAVVSPRGVYAATDDFGAGDGATRLGERIDKASADYIRMLLSCGKRTPRDPFGEDIAEMAHLLGNASA
jgi:FMN reductase